MGNAIAEKSILYKNLLEACKDQNYLVRFNKCYDLVENADYKEIHFIITMLKANENAVGETNVDLIDMLKGCIDSLFGNRGRAAFLLDILEEARGRKERK